MSGITSADFKSCEENPNNCAECDADLYPFPVALAGQSVLFDGPATVRICKGPGQMLKSMSVAMLDHVHSYWYEFYELDYRAKNSQDGGVCEDHNNKGSCRQLCLTDSVAQQTDGCGRCKQAGAFGGGKWVLPILTATQIVHGGNVAPNHRVSFVVNSASDVQMCKHDNHTIDGPGNTDGWNEHEVCAAFGENGAAREPRACNFPGLDGTDKFNPTDVYISEGVSIFCGGLLPDTLYSLSSHCYITNCKSSNAGSSYRRLLQVDDHDVVLEAGDGEQMHVPAKGIEFFHVVGDSTTAATPSDNEVAGLGSTIAITCVQHILCNARLC